jgi:signal peptidase I
MTEIQSTPLPADGEAPPKKAGPMREAWEFGRSLLIALAIFLAIRVLLFQPFTIPTASMVPTILAGDYIVVSKFAYGWSRHSFPFSPPIFNGRIADRQPKRGDVIVFKLPRDGRTDYIKRVIGLPGDKVQLKGGVVTVNGQVVPQTELTPARVQEAFGFDREVHRQANVMGAKRFTTYTLGADAEMENTDVYTVPAGKYFVMGDNRDNSLDSRYPSEIGVGFVPEENLVGRAEIILFSWSEGVSLFKPWTWVANARLSRFGHPL